MDSTIETNHIIEYICSNCSITCDNFSSKMRSELYKYSQNMRSKLDKFRISEYGDIICLKVNNVSKSIHATDDTLNRMLHCSDYMMIIDDNGVFKPLFYVPKCINGNTERYFTSNIDSSLIGEEIIEQIKESFTITDDMNDSFITSITVTKNYIGANIVIFNHDDIWYWCKNGIVYELSPHTNMLLCNNIDVNYLDTSLCYRINYVDDRLRFRIEPKYNMRFISLQSINEKYTLQSYDIYDCPEDIHDRTDMKMFKILPKLHFSCYDHMCVYVDKLNRLNLQTNSVTYKGIMMEIKTPDRSIYIEYNTDIYVKLCNMIPSDMTKYEAYLDLYKNNELNNLLKYQNSNKMTTIINKSMVTIGREILDIYFMTRRNNNEWIFRILGKTYQNLIKSLHSCYIKRKNMKKNKKTACNITAEDVYLKLKNIDTRTLVKIFEERYYLKGDLEANGEYYSNIYGSFKIIKKCEYTNLFTQQLLFCKY